MYKSLIGNKAVIKLSRSSLAVISKHDTDADARNLQVLKSLIVDANDIGLKAKVKYETNEFEEDTGNPKLITLSLVIPWSSIELINLVSETEDGWLTDVA